MSSGVKRPDNILRLLTRLQLGRETSFARRRPDPDLMIQAEGTVGAVRKTGMWLRMLAKDAKKAKAFLELLRLNLIEVGSLIGLIKTGLELRVTLNNGGPTYEIFNGDSGFILQNWNGSVHPCLDWAARQSSTSVKCDSDSLDFYVALCDEKQQVIRAQRNRVYVFQNLDGDPHPLLLYRRLKGYYYDSSIRYITIETLDRRLVLHGATPNPPPEAPPWSSDSSDSDW